MTPTAARVHVYRAGREVQSERAPDGEYQIGGLVTGTYWLVASPLSDDPFWLSAREGVTITPGLSQTVDLTLRSANVIGTVVDPNGIGVAGATVHVLGEIVIPIDKI